MWIQEMLSMENSSLGPPDGYSLIQVCREPLPCATSASSPPCSTPPYPAFDWFIALDTTWHYVISVISYHMTLYFLQHWFTQWTTFARWQLRKSFIHSYWPSKCITSPFLITHWHLTFYNLLMTFKKEDVWSSLG